MTIRPCSSWARPLLLVICALCLLLPRPAAAGGSPPPPPAGQPEAPPEAEKKPDAGFDSPRAAMFTFLESANTLAEGGAPGAARDNLIRVLDLGLLEADSASGHAAALLGVLNRLGEIRPEELPDASEVRDAGLAAFTYLPHERPDVLARQRELLAHFPGGVISFSRNDDDEWSFSERTIEEIQSFYDAVRQLDRQVGVDEARLTPSLSIERQLPRALVDNQFLGVKYWKWIGLAVVIFAGFVLDLCVRLLLRVVWARIAGKARRSVEKVTVARAVKPFGLFAAAALFVAGVKLLALPETAQAALLVAGRVLVTLAGIFAAWRVADLVGELFAGRAARSSNRFDDVLIPLVRKTAKVFIIALGIVYLANALSVDILPLLTGLGIGGLAFAFAAKDTIENLFGSVAVILDRPFDVGDWVVIGDTEGTVEELGFRSTRVRTFYNSLVTVPNATLVRASVDNFGRRKYRRYKSVLSLTYDTPPDRIEAFCEGVREIVRAHPYTRKDYYHVCLNDFGAHSLDVLLYVFFEAPDWGTELRERHRLMLDIIRLAHHLGVDFAFPTQTLYLRREDWAAPEPGDPPGASTERDARRRGVDAASALTADAPWRSGAPPPVDYGTPAAPPSESDGDSQVESRLGGS